jgi:hypothetical protein
MNKEQQEARNFLEKKVKENKDMTNGLQYLNISLYDSIAIVMNEFLSHKTQGINILIEQMKKSYSEKDEMTQKLQQKEHYTEIQKERKYLPNKRH